jgi:hypothetical protein
MWQNDSDKLVALPILLNSNRKSHKQIDSDTTALNKASLFMMNSIRVNVRFPKQL